MIMPMTARGRPRSAELDSAILEATRALLLKVGYSRLSMEAIAARAGVGKPTLYRRYPTKAAVVFEAVFGKTKELEDPDTGNVRADLIETYSWAVDEFASPEAQAALPGLMADVTSSPELAQFIRAQVIEPEYGRVRVVFERGQARGEIRDDVDLELVIDVFTGTALARASLLDHELDRDFGVRLVDLVLEGLEPRSSPRSAHSQADSTPTRSE
jgi:AcrR family transcriptional regulator